MHWRFKEFYKFKILIFITPTPTKIHKFKFLVNFNFKHFNHLILTVNMIFFIHRFFLIPTSTFQLHCIHNTLHHTDHYCRLNLSLVKPFLFHNHIHICTFWLLVFLIFHIISYHPPLTLPQVFHLLKNLLHFHHIYRALLWVITFPFYTVF